MSEREKAKQIERQAAANGEVMGDDGRWYTVTSETLRVQIGGKIWIIYYDGAAYVAHVA